MDELANLFSVLELDADDSHVHPLPIPSPSTPGTLSPFNYLFIFIL